MLFMRSWRNHSKIKSCWCFHSCALNNTPAASLHWSQADINISSLYLNNKNRNKLCSFSAVFVAFSENTRVLDHERKDEEMHTCKSVRPGLHLCTVAMTTTGKSHVICIYIWTCCHCPFIIFNCIYLLLQTSDSLKLNVFLHIWFYVENNINVMTQSSSLSCRIMKTSFTNHLTSERNHPTASETTTVIQYHQSITSLINDFSSKLC